MIENLELRRQTILAMGQAVVVNGNVVSAIVAEELKNVQVSTSNVT